MNQIKQIVIIAMLAATFFAISRGFSTNSSSECSLLQKSTLTLLSDEEALQITGAVTGCPHGCSTSGICDGTPVADQECDLNPQNAPDGTPLSAAARKAACEARTELIGANCDPSVHVNEDCPEGSGQRACKSAPDDKTGPCGKATYWICKYVGTACRNGNQQSSNACGRKCTN